MLLKENFFLSFLILLIFVGIFARFWALDSSLFWRDESIHFIAALKMNHHDFSINSQDPRFWFLEHPSIATISMGLLSHFVKVDYRDIVLLTKHYGYLYVPFEIIKETFYSMRLMSAVFGSLVVLMVFLITKKLWDFNSALWSAVLVSLSLDFIGISRIAYLEIFLIGYFLFALFFFLKFLDSVEAKKKFFYLFLTVFFTVLTLGTRWGPPFLLYPVLFFSFLFFSLKRKEYDWLFFLVFGLLVSWPIFYYFVLSPSVVDTIIGHISGELGTDLRQSTIDAGFFSKAFNSFEKVFGKFFQNNFLFVLGSFIFKHSYLFLFSLFLFIFYCFSKIFGFKNFFKQRNRLEFESSVDFFNFKLVKNFFLNPSSRIVIWFFFVFGFLFFSFSIFGSSLRYFTILFIPVIILMGKPLSEFSKNFMVKLVLVFLIFVNLFSIVQFFPYLTVYGNFGSLSFQVLDFFDWYNLIPQQQEIFRFLEEKGNPMVFTNLPNLLVFYKGEVLPVPPSDMRFSAFRVCEFDLEKNLQGSYIVLLGHGFRNEIYNGAPWYCPKFMELNVELVKEYGLVNENGERFLFGTISIFKPVG